jgi:glycosyltransferase involved in cell wall biosynthesis
MSSLFDSADILVSPRTKGNNTPMKIYSYLDSGKAVLATDIPSHTQVLNNNIALLAKPEPKQFAEAMQALAENKNLREQISQSAKSLVQEKYCLNAFNKTVDNFYETIEKEIQNNLTQQAN